MEEKVLAILQNVFRDESINQSCSQNNYEQWDSLHHLNVCFELENEFDVILEPEEMSSMQSFSDIITVLKSKGK